MKVIRNKATALAALTGAVACLGLLPFWYLGRTGAAQFRNVQELRGWARTHGLHCRSDRQDGTVTNALAVSTRPLDWEELVHLHKAPAEPGPQWSGIVWVLNRSANLDDMPAPPWAGPCRDWGGVVATGDPRLLDRIEREGPRH